MSNREKRPPTITSAKGFCVSDPTPVDSAAGSRPNAATSAVIMIGRRRSRAAVRVASVIEKPSNRSSFAYEMYTTAVCTETPNRARNPIIDDTESGVPVRARMSKPPNGAERITPTTVMNGNLKLW